MWISVAIVQHENGDLADISELGSQALERGGNNLREITQRLGVHRCDIRKSSSP
jgi:hypothetical protein